MISQKIGVTVLLFSMLLGGAAVSCGDPCLDLETEALKCCDQATDPAQKALCQKQAKQVEGGDPANCQANLDAYKCAPQ